MGKGRWQVSTGALLCSRHWGDSREQDRGTPHPRGIQGGRGIDEKQAKQRVHQASQSPKGALKEISRVSCDGTMWLKRGQLQTGVREAPEEGPSRRGLKGHVGKHKLLRPHASPQGYRHLTDGRGRRFPRTHMRCN